MGMEPEEFQRLSRIEFTGEPVVSLEGIAREWYRCMAIELFDPMLGLWKCSVSNPDRVKINSDSRTCLSSLPIDESCRSSSDISAS